MHACIIPAQHVEHTLGLSTSFDAGRGCPYQCSFCTIIDVQGRKSRFRSADDVEKLVRMNWAQGIHSLSPTTISPGTGIGKPSSTG
jgi:radical SAM superfamily enzyme with C-terminal helix-hairpin-helix motif